MNRQRINILKAVGWLAIGLGIGSGGTLIMQQWNSASATAPNAPVKRKRPPEPAVITGLSLQGEPVLGSKDAPLTIVEFSDFECSYCRRFHDQVLPSLKRDYIDTGLVRFVHKDLPLPFHRQAKPAAAAARCASDQNRYWDLYGALFNQQSCLECKGVIGIAEDINLDTSALQTCMEQDATQTIIKANLSEAKLNNIRATPTFIIGPSRSDEKHFGDIVQGALPWPQFKSLIDQQLNAERGG